MIRAALLLGALLFAGRAAADHSEPRAGGRLAAVLGGDLDLVGDVWVDLPAPAPAPRGLFVGLSARTTIERATSELAFLVRDLQYDMRAGWRRPRWSVAAGQRGRERVDADGQGFLQYLGVGAASLRFDDPGPSPAAPRLRWRVFAGPVVKEREATAEAVAQLDAAWRTGLASGRAALGLDLSYDGILDDGRLRGDLAGGPALDFAVAGGRRASFFLHHQRSRHPLGLEEDAWLAGFTYEEGRAQAWPRGRPPEIDGFAAVGSGQGRLAGELEVRFLSPATRRGLRAAFLLDANILTADDTGDLFYLYHVGLERELGGSVVGAWFYHRSNHQLAEPNERVTSRNVLETGIETAGWHLPAGAVPAEGRLRLDATARVGWLIDSSFGEDRPWNVRGGARAALCRLRPRPYLAVEAEAGDVQAGRYAIGVAAGPHLEAQIEYRRDEQLFSRDRRTWLASVRYGF